LKYYGKHSLEGGTFRENRMPRGLLKKIYFIALVLFSFECHSSASTAYLPPPEYEASSEKTETGKEEPLSFMVRFPEILGIVLFFLLITTYITALIRERKRYHFLLNNTAEKIIIIDRNGEVLESVSGDIAVQNLQDMLENEEWCEFNKIMEKSNSGKPGTVFRMELYTNSDNQSRYYQVTLQNMYHRREIRGIIVTLLDTTEAKSLEKELISAREIAYHEARHDTLTGVPNRLYFNEIVTRKFIRLERHEEETMCLLMMDLDHFKKINDTWGHDAGDIVLKELSRMCSDEIRGSDVFARYGGEEFVVFLDDLNLSEGIHVAERMRQMIETHDGWPEGIRLTISVGVTEYNDEKTLDQLIKKADIALYRAKALGRNRVCVFNPPQLQDRPQ
jgi:diguanylate cyclase (GGDEF)-like protein